MPNHMKGPHGHGPPPMHKYPEHNMKGYMKPNKEPEFQQNMYNMSGVEVLYSENNDGEITIEIEPSSALHKLVTAIDISSLYKEKRNKAIQLAKKFEILYHDYLVSPLCPVIMDGNKLYFQTEAPDNGNSCWKAFCKKKFTTIEMLTVFRQMCSVLHYLHSNELIHRDVHPTRLHLVKGKAKFNFIGMPYNYKKLLKKENFSGHINYSAPELIMEQMNFSDKVDIWSLGCCLYFLIVKKDPFEGKDPKTIKENIMKCNFDMKKIQHEPILANLVSACLVVEEEKRPHAFELLKFMNKIETKFYGKVVSDETGDESLTIQPGSFITMSPNTSGSFSQSFDNSRTSDDNSFDYGSRLMTINEPAGNRSMNSKKGLKLNSKSKEFVKNMGPATPDKQEAFVNNSESKARTYTVSSKNESLDVPLNQKYNQLGPVSERSQINEEDYDDSIIQKDKERNGIFSQEDSFGVVENNNQISFHSFNVSHIKEDQSFADTSFNTVYNLNNELNEEDKGSSDKLKTDLKANKLPSGYYKFRIFVPEKGELICKQHVVDLSSVKVISSTENSLGKVFMQKTSYLDYLLQATIEERNEEET